MLIRSEFPEEADICIKMICQGARVLLHQHKGCATLIELHYPMLDQFYSIASQPKKEHPISPPVLHIYVFSTNTHGQWL
jgi:hypothetical protein